MGFTVNGAVVPKSLALAAAGAEFRFSNNWSLLGDFRGEFGSGSQSYSGTGTVKACLVVRGRSLSRCSSDLATARAQDEFGIEFRKRASPS